MITGQPAAELFRKYREGRATPEEIALIESWQLQHVPEPTELTSEADRAADLADVRARLVALSNPPVRKMRWPRLAAAAAVIGIMAWGAWFFIHRSGNTGTSGQAGLVAQAANIAPARQGATLTLANGQLIRLNNDKTGVVLEAGGKMKYDDGTAVASSPSTASPAQMLTAATAKGQVYSFTLPDGSIVWLNAGSMLTFPGSFAGATERKVLLRGEAYFEVAKSYLSLQGHPVRQSFVVATSRQEVEVLGTHFNISAYDEEPQVKTTLLEGSVRVKPYALKQPDVVLTPNQQAILDGNGTTGLQVTTVDVQQTVAWKDGLFMYNNTTLEEVMRQAARWYNVEIYYEKESLRYKTLSGSVTRYDNLSGLLKAVGYTTGVLFRLEGNRLIVYN